MTKVKQLTVNELKVKLDNKENFRLIDCREPHEYDIAKIEGAVLMPLSQLAQKAPAELKQDEEIVIHCHHGGRSQRACEYLASIGYGNVSNLQGGIDAWAVEVDSKVQRY